MTVKKNKRILTALIAIISIAVIVFAVACSVNGNNQGNGDQNGVENGNGNTGGNGGETVEKTEKQIFLDELDADYAKVGHGNLFVNKGSDGNALSLLENGEEKQFSNGYFAHAYSVLVFENLKTQGFFRFSTYVGINKTARVNNTQASVIFKILLDNEVVYTSDLLNAYSDAVFVDIQLKGADRLTLIADSAGGNGNDHAVWADCKLTYYDEVKPRLLAYDVEFASPYNVTEKNILQNARATAFDGKDISSQITYETNYVAGKTGEFDITYKVGKDAFYTQKTVKMKVLSPDRFVVNASDDYLRQPFADFVYYGRSLLGEQSRKAYDLCMQKLLQADISDSSVNTLTVDLQAEGIYTYPSEVSKIKRYLIYDEARLYYLYDWKEGEGAGVSNTVKDGFVGTVTFKLYNGNGGYYFGQNNAEVYNKAEEKVNRFFSNLSYDMTDAQLLYRVQNAYRPTITYANVNYADGFYGAFITGQCICSGYSKGFSYLAQRLGIRAAYIVGAAGGAHAWNYLFADGGWYMSDTTWGDANSFGLLGNDYMQSSGRYDYGNYSKMPELSPNRYDLDIMKYPLMSLKSGCMIAVGQKFNPESLVTISGTAAQKAPLKKVTYSGSLNTSKAGTYTVDVTAENSLGNKISGKCEVFVYDDTAGLSAFTPVVEGNSNYAKREVSLYYGGKEKAFYDGIYTKANGTLSLTFDISGKEYSYFTAYVGVDKVIRDNVNWGGQVKATVRVFAGSELLFEKKNIGWKDDMTYLVVKLPQGTKSITLQVTDNTGQGGIGWGSCTLYR